MNGVVRRRSPPYPWYALPGQHEPLTTLDFLPAMYTLLENTQGIAGVCYAASMNPEACQQDVTQALFVLKEYLEAAVALFARWEAERHPGPISEEEAAPLES